MTVTLDTAIEVADHLAAKAWDICAGPRAFRWRDGLAFASRGALAQFVAARREATAAELYAFAVAEDAAAKPWADIPPALRVAVEVFRATMAVLLNEMERASPPRTIAPLPSSNEIVRRHAPVHGTSVAAGASRDAPRAEPIQLDIETEIDIATRAAQAWDNDNGRPARKGGRA